MEKSCPVEAQSSSTSMGEGREMFPTVAYKYTLIHVYHRGNRAWEAKPVCLPASPSFLLDIPAGALIRQLCLAQACAGNDIRWSHVSWLCDNNSFQSSRIWIWADLQKKFPILPNSLRHLASQQILTWYVLLPPKFSLIPIMFSGRKYGL